MSDDRPSPEGLSNDARLMRWVKANVPDTRIRQEGTEPVTMTGGELFGLLFQVTDWAYHNGTDDVRESPRRLAEFYSAGQPGRDRFAHPGAPRGFRS